MNSRPQSSKSETQAPSLPKYAEVVFNLPLRDRFTYQIPSALQPLIQVGMRVFAPFGRRRITGYVVGLTQTFDRDFQLKPIADLPDVHPVISEELLALTAWVADYYQSSWGEAIKAALPAGLDDESREVLTITEKGVTALDNENLSGKAFSILETLRLKGSRTAKQLQKELGKNYGAYALARLRQDGNVDSQTKVKESSIIYKREKIYRITPNDKTGEEVEALLKRSPRQREIYQFISQGEKPLSAILKEFPSSSSQLAKLREKGLIRSEIFKIKRDAPKEESAVSEGTEKPLDLTEEQKRAYQPLRESLDAGEFGAYLLHGVTGSGKTEIYLLCIQQALDQGKSAIMMVPEISLTPQTVERFRRRFGDRIAILHSGLSQKDRYREWEHLFSGRVQIVVGARSAVFAPLKNIGVIVIDEEHDSSYKQESTPRYHARDTAIVRAREQKAVVLLGSATPSLETRRNAETGKYRYLTLSKRVHNQILPIALLVNMVREREVKKNFSILSGSLKSQIRQRLERGEQTFLFLNRRGAANYIFCKECEYVIHCPRCSVTLTFHSQVNLMRCHYCDYKSRPPAFCPGCRGEVIRFQGYGTQKLEEETRQMFPNARIVRLDRDSVRQRDAFHDMHRRMKEGTIDILIGTQMITKGHDFPKVTLVGVILADLSLNIPDFRSSERSFQLLTQVAGRAGRGNVPGQVIIQTHNPSNIVFDFVREHDYGKFYDWEIKFRRKLNYPPFTRMIALEIESAEERLGEETAGKIKRVLVQILSRTQGVELLGPARAVIYRINEKFRWHIILRSQSVPALKETLTALQEDPLWRKTRRGLKLSIDVDPVNLL